MSLFHDIQASILEEDESLASVLLKLRLLASRLQSDPLAAWIRQELEGYNTGDVPSYRIASVAYVGSFWGTFGRSITNAPIPPVVIDKFAGEHFTRRKMTHSISAISKLALADEPRHIDGSDLILPLQGKVYPDYTCNAVFGIISGSDLVRILDTVRNRILDFTIAIGKEHPEIRDADLLGATPESEGTATARANQIVQQVIYANNVNNSPFSFVADLEKILVDRVMRSDSNESEKSRMVDSVKSAGIQEVIKQLVQKTPDLLRFLSTFG